MKIATILKLAQITLIAFAFLFTTSAIPSDAMAKEKGKPSFAGKPDEKLGKGGRSEDAKQHGKKEKKEKRERIEMMMKKLMH